MSGKINYWQWKEDYPAIFHVENVRNSGGNCGDTNNCKRWNITGNYAIALIIMNLNRMIQNACLYLKRDVPIPHKIMFLKRNAVTGTKPGIKISNVWNKLTSYLHCSLLKNINIKIFKKINSNLWRWQPWCGKT